MYYCDKADLLSYKDLPKQGDYVKDKDKVRVPDEYFNAEHGYKRPPEYIQPVDAYIHALR